MKVTINDSHVDTQHFTHSTGRVTLGEKAASLNSSDGMGGADSGRI